MVTRFLKLLNYWELYFAIVKGFQTPSLSLKIFMLLSFCISIGAICASRQLNCGLIEFFVFYYVSAKLLLRTV